MAPMNVSDSNGPLNKMPFIYNIDERLEPVICYLKGLLCLTELYQYNGGLPFQLFSHSHCH